MQMKAEMKEHLRWVTELIYFTAIYQDHSEYQTSTLYVSYKSIWLQEFLINN